MKKSFALRPLLVGLSLLLATAGLAAAADDLVKCNGKEYKTDEQQRVWEKQGESWVQIGTGCKTLTCSRRNLFSTNSMGQLVRYNGTANSWTLANELSAGQQLTAGTVMYEAQNLESLNGKYYLYMQENGELGIWQKEPRQKVWSNGTNKPNCTLKMQDDGNLAIYDAQNRFVWHTGTAAGVDARYAQAKYKPVRLLVTDDGRAELLSATGFKVWDSKSGNSPLN